MRQVGRRLGRAERGDHVVPVSTAEFDVDFRVPDGEAVGRPRAEILADMARRVRQVPGVFAAVGGPLADRIGHMLSGVSAPVAVKIFGPDLETLRRLGEEIQTVAKGIPGLAESRLDQQSTIPQLRVQIERDRALAYGFTPGALNEQVSLLVGGRTVAELQDGQRHVELVVRLPALWRETPERLAALPIQSSTGRWLTLAQVASVHEAKGPNVIFRENSQRRFTLAIKPTTRDVGERVAELQAAVAERVRLPEGYFVTYEGEFQAQQEATWRIALFSAAVLLAVLLLLYQFFQSWNLALQVMLSIPLALLGGLVFTWMKVDNISIATLVGFIAVAGVSARNGIMMLSHYLYLMKHEQEPFSRAMVERGTLERLVPVAMTALAAGIALIPLVLAGDEPGKEILHPVAVVIVGGLLSSTLLEFLVRPLVFFHFGRRAAQQAIDREASAAQ